MSIRRLSGAGLLLLAAAPLGAAPYPILGGQVALALPQGNLNGGKWVHGRAGLGLGLHATQQLDGGHALSVRADGTWIPQGKVEILASDGSTQLYAERAKVRILALGLDYDYFFAGTPLEGPYLLAGMAQSWMHQTGATLVPGGVGDPSIAWPGSSSASALQWALGFGDKFLPHLGWEFRFTEAKYSNVQVAGARMKAPMFTLALTTDF